MKHLLGRYNLAALVNTGYSKKNSCCVCVLQVHSLVISLCRDQSRFVCYPHNYRAWYINLEFPNRSTVHLTRNFNFVKQSKLYINWFY